jgi:hypothetical protein
MNSSSKRVRFFVLLLFAVATVAPYASANPLARVGSAAKSVVMTTGHVAKTVVVKTADGGRSVVHHVRHMF